MKKNLILLLLTTAVYHLNAAHLNEPRNLIGSSSSSTMPDESDSKYHGGTVPGFEDIPGAMPYNSIEKAWLKIRQPKNIEDAFKNYNEEPLKSAPQETHRDLTALLEYERNQAETEIKQRKETERNIELAFNRQEQSKYRSMKDTRPLENLRKNIDAYTEKLRKNIVTEKFLETARRVDLFNKGDDLDFLIRRSLPTMIKNNIDITEILKIERETENAALIEKITMLLTELGIDLPYLLPFKDRPTVGKILYTLHVASICTCILGGIYAEDGGIDGQLIKNPRGTPQKMCPIKSFQKKIAFTDQLSPETSQYGEVMLIDTNTFKRVTTDHEHILNFVVQCFHSLGIQANYNPNFKKIILPTLTE